MKVTIGVIPHPLSPNVFDELSKQQIHFHKVYTC